MGPSQGLVNQLNAIREISSEIYHQYVPVVTTTTDIKAFAEPILNDSLTVVRNEFVENLIGRIVRTQVLAKMFSNPLRQLEGQNTPLGYASQEIYTNPVEASRFNVNDFAGLLAKYEVETKVQYFAINMDLQYSASMTRDKLRNAFASWDALESYISSISNALYNGAKIDQYRYTTAIVASAYSSGRGIVEVITAPTDEATAKAFVKKARQLYLDFQSPSTDYTAWQNLNGGDTITTWTNPEDIVFIIRNDIAAELDVDVLASAFHIDRTTLMGNLYYVDNFNIYADDRKTVVYDGSKILGIMADRAFFKIETQDEAFDQFYNAKNRTWNMFLNIVKGYNMSLFAKHVIFATEKPTVTATAIKASRSSVTITGTGTAEVGISPVPLSATLGTVTYKSDKTSVATVAAKSGDNKTAVVTGVAAGTATITASAGDVSTTFTVTVK